MTLKAGILFLASLSVASGQTRVMGVCEALGSFIVHERLSIRGQFVLEHHGMRIHEGAKTETCPGWPTHFFTVVAGIPIQFSPSLLEQERRSNYVFLRK